MRRHLPAQLRGRALRPHDQRRDQRDHGAHRHGLEPDGADLPALGHHQIEELDHQQREHRLTGAERDRRRRISGKKHRDRQRNPQPQRMRAQHRNRRCREHEARQRPDQCADHRGAGGHDIRPQDAERGEHHPEGMADIASLRHQHRQRERESGPQAIAEPHRPWRQVRRQQVGGVAERAFRRGGFDQREIVVDVDRAPGHHDGIDRHRQRDVRKHANRKDGGEFGDDRHPGRVRRERLRGGGVAERAMRVPCRDQRLDVRQGARAARCARLLDIRHGVERRCDRARQVAIGGIHRCRRSDRARESPDLAERIDETQQRLLMPRRTDRPEIQRTLHVAHPVDGLLGRRDVRLGIGALRYRARDRGERAASFGDALVEVAPLVPRPQERGDQRRAHHGGDPSRDARADRINARRHHDRDRRRPGSPRCCRARIGLPAPSRIAA